MNTSIVTFDGDSIIKHIFEAIELGILVTNQEQTKLLLYNQSFINMWEIPNHLIDSSGQLSELFNYLQTKLVTSQQISFNGEEPNKTLEIELKNGIFLEYYTTYKTYNNQSSLIIHSFKNITPRKLLAKQLEKQATFDSLTGLPNRALLLKLLQINMALAKRNNSTLAVFFIDLDSFKAINDTFGHAIGDQLLKTFGDRLQKYVRKEDIVARLGGDEFIIAVNIDSIKLSNLPKIITRFLETMIKPYYLAEQELIVTLSMGITFYPQDSQDADELIKNADIAMYHAKKKGKNNFQLYNKIMSDQLLQRVQLENSLHIALQKKELSLHYQPIINLQNNKIIAMEALLRWNNPKLGTIPPNVLIPIAESNGTIFPIGLWVLRTACAQLKAWHDNNLPLIKMSINISECQLKQDDVVKTIKQVLQETNLDPKYLEIELAERVFLSSGNTILSKLLELKELGISVSLDDFGTCYSKLSTVKQFPVDSIKIDRAFIKDLTTHPGIKAIVYSMATVAKTLNLHVIAEGIETKEQLKVLSSLFQDEAQGYYFGKPAPAEEAVKLLKNQV